MKILAIALVILGAVGLIYGGIGYNRERTVLEVGGLKATTTEHKDIPFSPIVGAVALIGGVALLVVDKRRA
jgi:hypothetical protein